MLTIQVVELLKVFTLREIAELCGVSERTAGRWRADPKRIPWDAVAILSRHSHKRGRGGFVVIGGSDGVV